MSANFGNQILPGVTSVVDVSGLSAVGQLTYGTIGIAGLASAGTEDEVYLFTSAGEARSVLQGGAMLDAINAAYAAGALRVYAVRVGAPVAATKQFAAGANTDAMTLTAKSKGTAGNSIQVKIETGSGGAGFRIVSIRLNSNQANVFETFGGTVGLDDIAAIKAAINAGSTLVTCTDDATADEPDVTVGWVNLASGTDGTRSTTEVADGLDLLLGYPVDIVIGDIADTTYHAILLAHCVEASNSLNKSERTCVVGMPTGTTVSQYTAQATALADKRAVLVAPCVETPDFGVDATSSSVKAGHIGAAIIAGLKAGQNDPAEGITNQSLKFALGLEAAYSNGELETLIQGHVLPIALRRGGNVVIQQVTTSTVSGFEEWSVVTLIDYVMKDLRNFLDDTFIGKKGTPGILAVIQAAVKARLSLYVSQRILYSFIEDSVSVNFLPNDQRWINVSFAAVPIMPVNNIGIYAQFASIFNFNLQVEAG